MAGLSDIERQNRLRLTRTDQVGPVTFHALLDRFGTASRALDALPDLSRRGGRSQPLNPASLADIDREMKQAAVCGASLIVYGDTDYPDALAAAAPAPPCLWVIGQSRLLDRPCIALVGARIASAAGQRFARQLAGELYRCIGSRPRDRRRVPRRCACVGHGCCACRWGRRYLSPGAFRSLSANRSAGRSALRKCRGSEGTSAGFSATEPNYLRSQPGRRGCRSRVKVGIADHGQVRGRTRPGRVRRPRLSPGPPMPRHERPSSARRDPLRRYR